MDYNKAALEMHEAHHGKVGTVSKVEVKTRDDLATAYTPGVAEPCRRIAACPGDVYRYTCKGNMVAVVSNGTAVLGLGDIGPEAALPVMEGKAVLFKQFGGVDAFPICIDAPDAASVIAACKAIAPTFGGINLEDIKSPECFEIEQTLERELDIPVFHDDQHGTAIVVAMANPTPEIMPDEAKAGGVRVIATGRSDFPNQVNNVLCFPGLFKGALSVRARDINDAMKLAAAYAIADLISDGERSDEYIIPGAFDPRVAESVAAAVAKAARETGVARL